MNEAYDTSPQNWLQVHRGSAPLIVSFPHTGTDIPSHIEARLISPWLARKDTDWWVHLLYAFVHAFDATIVRTPWSRTVVDVNRDPSGNSLYPGQAVTELCPLTTFDGESLYRRHSEPDAEEVSHRRVAYFEPYHQALATEILRLRSQHENIVLYEAHSIRSRIPRLFSGSLPNLNIGTNDGASCASALTAAIEATCEHSGFTWVTNGRFKGGWTTRHYGEPQRGIHAVQMELACRGYMAEPTESFTPENWPPAFDSSRAAAMRTALTRIMQACLTFTQDFSRSLA